MARNNNTTKSVAGRRGQKTQKKDENPTQDSEVIPGTPPPKPKTLGTARRRGRKPAKPEVVESVPEQEEAPGDVGQTADDKVPVTTEEQDSPVFTKMALKRAAVRKQERDQVSTLPVEEILVCI